MDKTEITRSAFIWVCAVSGRGRMAGLELVLLARICERVGVVVVSTMLLPNQYRPCLLPPSTLMTIKLWPMNFLCHRGVATEAAVDACVAVRFGLILRVEGDIGCRLPFVSQTICLDLGARHTTMCHRLRKKSGMIRNLAELEARIK